VPTNLAALATISGVGQVTLERYGNLFLEVLRVCSAAAQSTGEPIG
jgi:superfamily II DNA helicase RecQ